MYRPTRLEISTERIRHNYRWIRSSMGKHCKIIAVLKANAYGMGAVPIARILTEEGCTHFAVALVEEAIELRDAGHNQEILVMTVIHPSSIPVIVSKDITISCGSVRLAKNLSEEAKLQGKNARVHIKIDTGLGRTGFIAEKALSSVLEISKLDNLDITGIYTHFAVADERHRDYTEYQFKRFRECLDNLKESGIDIPFSHACNSPATVNFPEMQLDAVRPGNLLYGIHSGYESTPADIKFACSLKTEIASVRELPRGSGISYGLNYMTRGNQRIGILPIGFFDGFTRMFRNPEVLIQGHRVPVIGTICMDQTMVDLTDLPNAIAGDEVVMMGQQGEEEITVDDLMKDLNTIATQVLGLISSRVPRVYL